MNDYGLKRKYIVRNAETGRAVENCFVLRPEKDLAAVAAIRAYAAVTDNTILAADLLEWVGPPPNDPLTLEELREKDGRLVVQKPLIPGDTVWVIERDECEEPIEISGYMFFAFVGRAAIVSSFINDSETLDETVEYHIEETLNNYDTDLSVFPKNDCYLTRDAAKAALKKEGTTT